MIDEKKIGEAAAECRFNTIAQLYSLNYAHKGTVSEEQVNLEMELIEGSFEKGIEWFKKNIWHDTKEEPLLDELLIVQYIKDHRVKYMMYCWDSLGDCSWAEDVIDFHITKWCYIKDLI